MFCTQEYEKNIIKTGLFMHFFTQDSHNSHTYYNWIQLEKWVKVVRKHSSLVI